jgi:hypothetical protein
VLDGHVQTKSKGKQVRMWTDMKQGSAPTPVVSTMNTHLRSKCVSGPLMSPGCSFSVRKSKNALCLHITGWLPYARHQPSVRSREGRWGKGGVCVWGGRGGFTRTGEAMHKDRCSVQGQVQQVPRVHSYRDMYCSQWYMRPARMVISPGSNRSHSGD